MGVVYVSTSTFIENIHTSHHLSVSEMFDKEIVPTAAFPKNLTSYKQQQKRGLSADVVECGELWLEVVYSYVCKHRQELVGLPRWNVNRKTDVCGWRAVGVGGEGRVYYSSGKWILRLLA